MRKQIKTAKTIKEYKTNYHGYELVIPVGTTVSNSTACGPDDDYHFLNGIDKRKIAKEVSGFDNSILLHDLTYYGLNIPSEYCESYK